MSAGGKKPDSRHLVNISEMGDAILKTEEERDYVRELAEHNLILARLQASLSKEPRIANVLGNISEEENVLYQVLAKINGVSESSPQYAQLMRLTGKKGRIEIAKVIAAQVWDKHSRKKMYEPFEPTAAELGNGGLFGYVVAAVTGSSSS